MGNYIKYIIYCQVNYPTYIYFFVPKMPSDLHSFSLKLPSQISLIIIVPFLQAQRAYSIVSLVFREFQAPCCYHLFKTPALADSVVMVINCEIHPGSVCTHAVSVHCSLQVNSLCTLTLESSCPSKSESAEEQSPWH